MSGIWATIFMDSLAKILSRRGLICSFITPEAMGRWFLYLCRGKFTHEDINRTPAMKNEYSWYTISHYLIGIILAGIYLLLGSKFQAVGDHSWTALAYGFITVSLPWFWLLPSTGLGRMAKRSPLRRQILKTNLINHMNFGFGLFFWMILVNRLLLHP